MTAIPADPPAVALKDLLEDGFLLLDALRNGASPGDAELFSARVDAFLADYDRRAARLDRPGAEDAKYAFCALLDETILGSGLALREAWAQAPLQLRKFGDHLAGEGFFRRLEALRREPGEALEALEVFQACLLHGFKGRYRLEGTEPLRYLMLALGGEIRQAAGDRAGLAPRWRPDPAPGPGRRPTLPGFCAALALAAVSLYLAYALILRAQADPWPGPVRELAAAGARGGRR